MGFSRQRLQLKKTDLGYCLETGHILNKSCSTCRKLLCESCSHTHEHEVGPSLNIEDMAMLGVLKKVTRSYTLELDCLNVNLSSKIQNDAE